MISPLREHPLVGDLRWVKAEGLHLTLGFLGETPESRLPGLRAALDDVASRHSPLTLEVGAAGTFGNRVLWLDLRGQLEEARSLQAELAAAVEVVETRPWSAHLTLARARKRRGEPSMPAVVAALGTPRPDPFTVGEVTLFETRGGRYFALHRAPLRG